MEYRQLGGSGFKVPALCFGTGTFGGGNEFFKAWGSSDVAEATRLVDVCLEAGLTMFDSADVYSSGHGRGDPGPGDQGPPRPGHHLHQGHIPFGPGPNDVGSSRFHLIQAVEASLRRLGTDYIDLYQLHGIRCADADRGGAGHARRPDPRRQDPLHRLLELLRLAPDEVAGSLGALRPGPLCRPPGVLFAHRSRLRMGADAAGARSEGRRSRRGAHSDGDA